MVATGSKCRTCKAPAIIDLPRHNANFCAEHFQELCRRQVAKAIEHWEMFGPDDRLLLPPRTASPRYDNLPQKALGGGAASPGHRPERDFSRRVGSVPGRSSRGYERVAPGAPPRKRSSAC